SDINTWQTFFNNSKSVSVFTATLQPLILISNVAFAGCTGFGASYIHPLGTLVLDCFTSSNTVHFALLTFFCQ
ncbi:hypothetical protein, partial [Acetivibrio straminisolvens]|uniref:hypothetical protein n=1 Tax=Acetivibrio straminisolvens TaxID=253314 RepID=UPI001FB17A32